MQENKGKSNIQTKVWKKVLQILNPQDNNTLEGLSAKELHTSSNNDNKVRERNHMKRSRIYRSL